MGEYTDMILEGTLCQSCGGVVEKESMGFPQDCEECEAEK
jgi:predicted Zn-ribbon and HTH transcriptional regulator